MLYAGTGDAADRGRSQDLGNLGGKILRMTPGGPPGAGQPVRRLAGLQLRPPQRAGHRLGRRRAGCTPSEFGQNRYDELNRIEPGRNYGWPEVEGTGDATTASSTRSPPGPPTTPRPSGIAVVGDRVYIACLRGERLYRVGLDGAGARALLSASTAGCATSPRHPTGRCGC